jgi:hypothetical protein
MRPSALKVLELLAEAGPGGRTGSDIAHLFDEPTDLLRRLTHVNYVLRNFEASGRARRGDEEPSPRYQHSPTVRWFVTPAGRKYLAAGGHGAVKRARLARAADQAREAQRLRALVLESRTRFGPDSPQHERLAESRRLRAEGVTLEDIGGIFGVTRERIRQLLAGIKVPECQCGRPDCR